MPARVAVQGSTHQASCCMHPFAHSFPVIGSRHCTAQSDSCPLRSGHLCWDRFVQIIEVAPSVSATTSNLPKALQCCWNVSAVHPHIFHDLSEYPGLARVVVPLVDEGEENLLELGGQHGALLHAVDHQEHRAAPTITHSSDGAILSRLGNFPPDYPDCWCFFLIRCQMNMTMCRKGRRKSRLVFSDQTAAAPPTSSPALNTMATITA